MNIVIVDDEQIIVSWLKKMLESISIDNYVVKSCLNGYEAVEYCLNYPVDVLFTDICMPILDGIGLIQELKKRNKMPYTIILTAYDDFSYAREALKLGAREFLLKTEITEQNLAECIAMARKELNLSNPLEQDELAQCLTEFLQTDGENDITNLESCWEEQVGKEIMILMLRVMDKKQIQQCEEVLTYMYIEENIVYYRILLGEEKLVIFSKNSLNTVKFHEKIKQTLSSFGFGNCYITIKSVDLVNELKKAWEEMKVELAYQEYYQYFGFHIGSELQKKDMETKEIEINRLIEIEDYQHALLSIETWLDMVEDVKPPIEVVRRSALQFLLLLYWDKLSEEQCKIISVEAITTIMQATDFICFRILLLERVKQLLVMLETNKKTYSAAVVKAMLFMKENYQESLTLNEISSTVHLNRSYLSTLFKKETGMNLMDYLQRCRIDEAKKLLERKELSIYQICECVGIVDATYFTKIFKKYEGKTPLEYRKSH